MKRLTWLYVFLIYMAMVKVAYAGYYNLIEGKGVAVCDAYYQYLKTQTISLTCKREFPPEMPKLQRLSWIQLDINKNKLLSARIENYLQIPRDEKAAIPWSPAWREDELSDFSVTKPGRSLFIADIDIDNDGVKETVAKYRSYFCHTWDFPDKAPSWKAPIVVVDEAKQSVNIKLTYPLMQNRDKRYLVNYDELQARLDKLSLKRKVRQSEIYRRIKQANHILRLSNHSPWTQCKK